MKKIKVLSVTKKGVITESIVKKLREDSEYQDFFKRALDKAGETIPNMTDDEKKAFFNKIDAAWDGRGEKKEVDEVTVTENTGDDLYAALSKVKGFNNLGADQQGELIMKIEKLFKGYGIH